MYEIIRMFISKNRPSIRLNPIGVAIHETANPGATALNHFKYFNSNYRGASAHVFVDWDNIIQTIPWDERAWHAGRTANKKYIGIELCRPRIHADKKFNLIWEKGVWLTAYLFTRVMNIRNVTVKNLISHYEISKKWRETTHVDPIGYFKEYGKTLDDFRKDVQAEINKMVGDK